MPEDAWNDGWLQQRGQWDRALATTSERDQAPVKSVSVAGFREREPTARSSPLIVKFVSKRLMGVPVGGRWLWERQLPTRTPHFDGVTFVFDDAARDYDAVVVFGGLPDEGVEVDASADRVFVASEPATYERYNRGFLRQFDLVLTTDARTRHPNRLVTQCGNPWHVGAWRSDGTLSRVPLSLDEFRGLNPRKDRLLSVVTSVKSNLPGHRARLEFVLALKRYFGDDLDVYGRGLAEIPDKSVALMRYRFHIAIENSAIDHYWTEKLADPFLALSFPIYYGAPNITEYFPRGSLASIDIRNHSGAIETIRSLLQRGGYEAGVPHLLEARRRVMEEHNLFAVLARALRTRLPPRQRSARSVSEYLTENASFESTALRFARRLGRAATGHDRRARRDHARTVEALRREMDASGE